MTRRTPAQYDWTNALFNDRRLTKHFTHPRRGKISHVTLHHMTIVSSGTDASNSATLEGCYTTWQTREASANYGVAGDQVWQFVGDGDAPWADANGTSNQSTLAIEHANSTAGPKWEIADKTMATGQRLVATLHHLYGLGRPSRKTVKVHRDFYTTACPGPYMMAHLDAYIAGAAKLYDGEKPPAPVDPKPVPVEPTDPKPTPEVPVPTADSCVFNYLGINEYASQYTGGVFSAKRKAALKATFSGPTGANASWNSISEVNRPYDHDNTVALLGKQFDHADTYTRAKGNNHHYPDANKWEKVRAVEIDLIGRNQHRTLVLVDARHKATGVPVVFGATHLSSASAFRDRGLSSAQASKEAAADQVAEAKAIARILANLPDHLPGADVDRFIGYFDTNRADGIAPYLDGHGTTDVYDLVKVGNREYGSLHDLGKAPAKDEKHIDRVRVGKKVKVLAARQLIGHYDANDHLGLACTFEVSR
jgi:hypothetical protein